MAQVILHSYYHEDFRFLGNVRQRALMALALIGGGGAHAATVYPNTPHSTLTDYALSNYGLSPDTPETDLFLGAYDNGHLIGSQLGGERRRYNLVPMAMDRNRGGIWNQMETAVAKRDGYGIYIVRAIYDDRRDGRIPVRIIATMVPIHLEFAQTLYDNWDDWRDVLSNSAQVTRAEALATAIQSGIEDHEEVLLGSILRCEFDQEDLEVRGSQALVNVLLLINNYQQALQGMAALDEAWTVEADPLFKFTTWNPDDSRNTNMDFIPLYRLPPVEERIYAVLDYMSLRGMLNGVVPSLPNSHVHITETHNDTIFPPAMKAIIQFMNQHLNRSALDGQRIFVSDRRNDQAMRRDAGTLGQGLVAFPAFDHVIPRTPLDGGRFGPTIFSNVQLVSTRYNSQKGNRPWHGVPVEIGAYLQRINTRLRINKQDYVKRRKDENRQARDREGSPSLKKYVVTGK